MIPVWVSDLLRVVTFMALLWLMWYSRRWTGPKQDAELRALENDFVGVKANINRLDRDLHLLRREFAEVNDQLLNELRMLRDNSAKEVPLEEQIRDVKDAIFELERTIAAMPCALHVQNNLKTVPKVEPD